MDPIQHKFVNVGALKLHVAETGTGENHSSAFYFYSLYFTYHQSPFSGPNAVVFLHGFPEIWYSWRHQMIALAGAGFRAVSFDYRGYGLSDPPPEPDKTSWSDLLSDLLHILDALALSKVLSIL